MDDHPNTSHVSPFDAIKHINENGEDYWSARELYKLLGYSTWQKFQYAIEQAKIACKKSGYTVPDHLTCRLKWSNLALGASARLKTIILHVTPATLSSRMQTHQNL
jgi:DNA-damage-inducible protein D